MSQPLTTRPLRVALALFALLAMVLAGCGSDDDGAASDSTDAEVGAGTGAWEFTDDQGITHQLDHVPERIAAQSVVAGGLWEYGIVADGVFGPLRRADGTPDPSLGLADPDDFTSLGEVDSEINMEALAAMQPDIIVAPMWSEDEFWGIADDEVDTIRQIAPIVGIRVDGRPVTEPLERFAELAESLGVDLDEGDAAAARAEFDRASGALSEALAANPDLQVAAVSGTLSEMYVAYPPGFPDLQYFQSLGMNLVVPDDHPTSGGFWETLSWEQAGKYPADLILADTRAGTPDEIVELLPVSAASLPAIAAGQMAEWLTTHAYGYGHFATILGDLTVAVADADPTVDS